MIQQKLQLINKTIHLNKVFDEKISAHDISYHSTVHDKFIFNNWVRGGVGLSQWLRNIWPKGEGSSIDYGWLKKGWGLQKAKKCIT